MQPIDKNDIVPRAVIVAEEFVTCEAYSATYFRIDADLVLGNHGIKHSVAGTTYLKIIAIGSSR
jgi:hypothetical protein